MNEMDRIRFNLGWYLYKLRAWWRGVRDRDDTTTASTLEQRGLARLNR